jgi:hypothetical protein
MIPRGVIFRELRSRMVSHFPDESKSVFRDSGTVGEWLTTGSLSVTKCSKKEVIFEAPQVEFASILLTEIENFLNHCFEHLQELGCVSYDERVRSQAWNTVTAYYFAFFSGSALLRLLGCPVLFLKREQLSSFATMLGGGVASPHQGSFELVRTKAVSATYSEFRLRTTSKIHEATWINLLNLFDGLRRHPPAADAKEALFYDSLCTKLLFPHYLNFEWPASIRNRANYRPGFAYKLQTGRSPSFKLIEDWARMEPPEATRIIDDAVTACRSDIGNFDCHVRLMIAVGTSLFLLARELYSELLARKGLDRRWEQTRRVYRKKMVFPIENDKMLLRTF